MRPALALAAVLVAFFAAAAPAAAEDAPSDRSLACLAEAVYYEARGEPIQGRAAVAYVVLNRAESGKFPETPCAVVAEGCQFSYRCDGRPEALAVRADRDAAFATAKAVLTGAVADPTNGALFFHASRIAPAGSRPAPASARSATTSSTADRSKKGGSSTHRFPTASPGSGGGLAPALQAFGAGGGGAGLRPRPICFASAWRCAE